jgi:sugar lactone lactonase YvrE
MDNGCCRGHAVLLSALVGVLAACSSNGEASSDESAVTSSISNVEIVATLEDAPGNIAVSKEGRVFINFHPLGGMDIRVAELAEGKLNVRPIGGPKIKVAELVDGKPVPFPNDEFQFASGEGHPYFDSPFSVRIDRQGRLWAMDVGFFGLRPPRLFAFDIHTKELLYDLPMPSEIAGTGSNVQDFQLDRDGRFVYFADESSFAHKPALIVLDLSRSTTTMGRWRRLLENKPSTLAEPGFQGRTVKIFGLVSMHPALDSIALGRDGEWLYYGAVATKTLYRLRTTDINDESLSDDQLSARVETYATKPESGGISTDEDGNVYINNLQDGRVDVLGSDRRLSTVATHPKMRWPDGLGFGPDGFLYVADSDLPDIIFQPELIVGRHKPYYVFRFPTGHLAEPGH